jgi:hypothetical protein
MALRPAALSLPRFLGAEPLFLLPAGRPLRLVAAALPPSRAFACSNCAICLSICAITVSNIQYSPFQLQRLYFIASELEMPAVSEQLNRHYVCIVGWIIVIE